MINRLKILTYCTQEIFFYKNVGNTEYEINISEKLNICLSLCLLEQEL